MTAKRKKVHVTPAGARGKRRQRRHPTKIRAAERALLQAAIGVEAAYRNGAIDSGEWNRRLTAITRKKIDLEDEKRLPYFKEGQTVEHVRGERGVIYGHIPADPRSSPMYRVVRGQERGEAIHDIWPEETVTRIVSKR